MSTEIMEMEAKELEIIQDSPMDNEAIEDIEEARQTYKELLTRGKSGLDIAYNIVEGSEHPRAVEVFSTLISNLAGINSKLIDLHLAKQELKKKVSVDQQPAHASGGITNNNVFVGSPKDVLELLKQSQG